MMDRDDEDEFISTPPEEVRQQAITRRSAEEAWHEGDAEAQGQRKTSKTKSGVEVWKAKGEGHHEAAANLGCQQPGQHPKIKA